jgi:hypothetical protein
MNVLRRRDSEALVNGEHARTPGFGAVEQFLGDMRVEAVATPAPTPRPRLAATLDGRRPLRPASDPVPVMTRSRPGRTRALRPAAAAIATGAVFFGGLAGAGALPGPLQRTSAQLSSHVGIHLPGATHTRAPQENGQPDTRNAGNPKETRSNPTNAAPPATSAPVTTTTSPPTVGIGPTPPTTPKPPISAPGTVKVPSSSPPPVITLPSLPLRHLPTLPAK